MPRQTLFNMMSQAFVPLHPVGESGVATTFRLQVIPGAEAVAPCSKVASAPAAEPDAQPVVDLQREGDRVTGARVRCACGRVIELAFTF